MELLRKFHGRDDSDGGDDSSVLPSQSDQPRGSMTRKRRRGIIEKKRRDRINNCLSELKRLVPAAFEKQGSQKLEKAEILQMTVEHLHFIRSKGADTFLYDPQRFATDYHSMGFRDCATEVARYLTSVEGMDSQDPVRIRLMTHLQTYNIQRAGHSWTNGQWSAGAANNTLSWPATNSGGKFETSAAYGISPYTVGDSTYAANSGLSANQNYSSMHMITSSTNQIQGTSFRAPIAAASGPFQPVVGGSNGTTAAATAGGLNINLAFLTSANSGHTGANGSSMVGRNGWNPSDMSSY